MSFLYFIPTDAPAFDPNEIERLGLGYAIERPVARGCTGPDRRRGFVMSSTGKPVMMNTASQTWAAGPRMGLDKPAFYVGWEGELPTAEGLRRDAIVAGDKITLVDGSVWVVPRLIDWQEGDSVPAVWSTRLPICIDVDDYGNPCDGAVVLKYRDLFDTGMRVIAKFAGAKDDPITSNQAIAFAANCLGVNYRVSLLELSSRAMSCLSTDDAVKIIHAAVDWQGYQAALGNWAGRQGRPTIDTESGSEPSTQDEPAATDRPLAN